MDNSFAEGVYKENKDKDDLLWAARSRILTDEEMGKLSNYGIRIFLHFHPSPDGRCATGDVFRQEELEKRLNDVLLQQFRFRAAVTKETNA